MGKCKKTGKQFQGDAFFLHGVSNKFRGGSEFRGRDLSFERPRETSCEGYFKNSSKAMKEAKKCLGKKETKSVFVVKEFITKDFDINVDCS